uniref:Uncharacterized protein n=1 Tax=Anguilla anguilla TaxID=7936 RepID=A0A0E9QGJ0_ANGAN
MTVQQLTQALRCTIVFLSNSSSGHHSTAGQVTKSLSRFHKMAGRQIKIKIKTRKKKKLLD